MGFPMHTVEVMNGLMGFSRTDRIFMGLLPVAYAAGSGAGVAVTVPLTLPSDLPATAAFFVGEASDVTASISGGTLTVEPRNPANTVAAGSVAVLVVA